MVFNICVLISSEIDGLLNEIKDLRNALKDAQRTIDLKEKEIIKTHDLHLKGSGATAVPAHLGSTSKLRMDLVQRWEELKTPVSERIATLSALLDSASLTPGTLAVYESISARLTDRAPIVQLLNRKQFLEYKLKLANRASVADGSGAAGATAERADQIAELSEVKTQLEKLIKVYERTHNETFTHPSLNAGNVDAFSSPSSRNK